MTRHFNRVEQKPLRRQLRREPTPAEALLWSQLRGRQLAGHKFRRQYSVGPYVLDFYSAHSRLAIEVDGDTHAGAEAQEYDRRRQQFIEEFGIRFVRVTNQDVFENMEGVIDLIAAALKRCE